MKNFGTKLKAFIKNNALYIICASFLLLANILLIFAFFINGHGYIDGTFPVIIILGIILEILFCTILFFAKKHHWHIEKLFLIMGLSVGSLYVFAIPLSCAPDEIAHFFRIYEISDGYLSTTVREDGLFTGSVQPSNLQFTVSNLVQGKVKYSEIIENLKYYDEGPEDFAANSAGGYSIISYLPHTAGMFIGKTLNLPIIASAYISRMFHLITCIIILYFCIKYIPFLKFFIFFLAFLPMSMQSMASLSADGFLICSTFSLITFILYATFNVDFKVKPKHLLLLLLLCLIVSLGKSIYSPVCLLLFTIPKERFGGMSRKLISIFSLGIITLVTLLLWLRSVPALSSVTDASTQLDTLIHHPFTFIRMLGKTLIVKSPAYLGQIFGRFLEWFTLVLTMVYVVPSGLCFVYLIIKERKNVFISKWFRILSIFAICFAALASFIVMYIQWTPVDSTIIQGVQGRYFMPLLLLVPIIFFPKDKGKKITKKTFFPVYQNNYIYLFIIFESVYALSAAVCFHI